MQYATAIALHAKVLRDPLVLARDGVVKPSKLFNNHNALGQLTNHGRRAFIKPGTNRDVCVRLGRKVL